MKSPPNCPRFSDASVELFDRYQQFIVQDGQINESEVIIYSQNALQLVRDLELAAMNLGYSRVYEFSPDIYWLTQCAAIVALLAFGRQSPEFLKQEAKVQYYKKYKPDRVEAFATYVKAHSSSDVKLDILR